MTLDLRDCVLFGPALPEQFVRYELGPLLCRLGLLPTGPNRRLERAWDELRRRLRLLGGSGGPQRVCNHVIAPLAQSLGYGAPVRQDAVSTREGMEDGGWLMQAPCGAQLRAWTVGTQADLDAPHRSGRAYRFSPTRSAQRVLLATAERVGLLTNGDFLRLLLCDPARPDSHITVPLAGAAGWRAQALAPDSFRLLVGFVTPKGAGRLADVLDAACLYQSRVTKELRVQARNAIEGFLKALLDHPANSHLRAEGGGLAVRLWEEALILVHRVVGNKMAEIRGFRRFRREADGTAVTLAVTGDQRWSAGDAGRPWRGRPTAGSGGIDRGTGRTAVRQGIDRGTAPIPSRSGGEPRGGVTALAFCCGGGDRCTTQHVKLWFRLCRCQRAPIS
jgi:hypothetical protein